MPGKHIKMERVQNLAIKIYDHINLAKYVQNNWFSTGMYFALIVYSSASIDYFGEFIIYWARAHSWLYFVLLAQQLRRRFLPYQAN